MRCDLCGFIGRREVREVNLYDSLWLCRTCFLSTYMLERFEFASEFRGPMAVLKWNGFEVRCTSWPETWLTMLKVGCLGPKAAEEAQTLLDGFTLDF